MPARTSLRPRTIRNARHLRPAEIDRLRERYVTMIAVARRLETGPNAFVEKANRLLTTHWAGTSWAARGDILKTVDWLLRVGAQSATPQTPAPERASR